MAHFLSSDYWMSRGQYAPTPQHELDVESPVSSVESTPVGTPDHSGHEDVHVGGGIDLEKVASTLANLTGEAVRETPQRTPVGTPLSSPVGTPYSSPDISETEDVEFIQVSERTPVRPQTLVGENRAVSVLNVDENGAAFKKAMAAIDGDTSAWKEAKKVMFKGAQGHEQRWALTRGVISVARFIGGVLGYALSPLSFGKAGAMDWAKQENANRKILREGRFELSPQLQDGQNKDIAGVEAMQVQAMYSRTGTGATFADITAGRTANHGALPMSAHMTATQGANAAVKVDLVQQELKPQLQAWQDALVAVGAGLSDDEYRALVAIATNNVTDQMIGNDAKNFVVENAAAFYGSSAESRIGSTLAARMNTNTLVQPNAEGRYEGVAKLHQDIAERAALIAQVTGRDAEEVETKIYEALNADPKFVAKMQKMETTAHGIIKAERDLDALKASFVEERLKTAGSLAHFAWNTGASKGIGEEFLKKMLVLTPDDFERAQAAQTLINGGETDLEQLASRKGSLAQDRQALIGQFQEMFDFLGNLEDDFEAYVLQHEEKAQAQLDALHALHTLRGQGPAANLEGDLIAADKIPAAIDASTAKADPIDDRTLVKFFDTLAGEGTVSNPGAPTMLARFVQTLEERGKIEMVDQEDGPAKDKLLGLTDAQLAGITKAGSIQLPLRGGAVTMREFDRMDEVRAARGTAQAQREATRDAEEHIVVEEQVDRLAALRAEIGAEES